MLHLIQKLSCVNATGYCIPLKKFFRYVIPSDLVLFNGELDALQYSLEKMYDEPYPADVAFSSQALLLR